MTVRFQIYCYNYPLNMFSVCTEMSRTSIGCVTSGSTSRGEMILNMSLRNSLQKRKQESAKKVNQWLADQYAVEAVETMNGEPITSEEVDEAEAEQLGMDLKQQSETSAMTVVAVTPPSAKSFMKWLCHADCKYTVI